MIVIRDIQHTSSNIHVMSRGEHKAFTLRWTFLSGLLQSAGLGSDDHFGQLQINRATWHGLLFARFIHVE